MSAFAPALPALLALACAALAAETPVAPSPPADFHFIDTSFENASPLHWDFTPEGEILISLQYDHQRASPNRAAGHWHFRVEGKPGSTHTLVLQNFNNVWNGKPGLPINRRTACLLSEDGRTWRTTATQLLEGGRLKIPVTLGPTGALYLARVEPYRLSDLDKLLAEIRPHPLVKVDEIGRTIESRPLEIIRVGHERAPFRVFLRARAHPWEPGGNWVVQGLIRKLLDGSPESAAHLERFSVAILPMANKDGVARGRTRFNLAGWDLNRAWDQPAPRDLAPENHALEQWLAAQIARGQRPHLALELHNDSNGLLHISRPDVPELAAHLARMARLEALLRKHTWFTEGSTGGTYRNPGSLGEGWLERFRITAAVYEFNADWIAGKEKMPLGADWEELGGNLPKVFADYFAAEQP